MGEERVRGVKREKKRGRVIVAGAAGAGLNESEREGVGGGGWRDSHC